MNESHDIESVVKTKNYSVQLINYDWREVEEYTWSIHDGYIFDLALSPRLRPAYIVRDGGGPVDYVGRVMLVPPGRVISSGGAVGRQRSLMCQLSASLIDEVAGAKLIWDEKPVDGKGGINFREIQWLLLKLHRELRNLDDASEVMVGALTTEISVEIVRYFNRLEGRLASYVGGLSLRRMRLIRERASIGPAPTVDELASLCGLSIRHLGRAFREETGQTVAKFVEALTLERATSLLKETNLPVAEIAAQLGFSTSASLAAMFRRNTGISPSSIRRSGADSRPGMR